MSNVAHASLTGSNLHESKGVATAAAGTVYIADGAGSGAWTASDSIATGMVSTFMTPIAPTGWLELNGAAVSISTYSALYAAVTIQQTGTRGGGSAIITSLSSTTNMKPGYYVFGTGITSGTTILTVDSSTQITMSANAGSGGSATVIVSPYLISATQLTLPDLTTSGKFLRSRTSSVAMGVAQSDVIKNHTHTFTSDAGGAHTHTGTTASNGSHSHTVAVSTTGTISYSNSPQNTLGASNTTTSSDGAHTHSFTTDTSATHTHTGTSDNNASGSSTETRPTSFVVMYCVKT